MFGQRDFLDDSSSSFEAEGQTTPPNHYLHGNEPSGGFEREFDFEVNRSSEPISYPQEPIRPIQAAVPSGFTQPKKDKNEKVGFVNFVDEPPSEPMDRPTSSARPGSSSQMRAKMLEAKKKQLMERPGGAVIVGAGGMLGTSKMGAAPLDNLLYSDSVFNEREISGTKALKAFNTGGNYFEPSAGRNQFEAIPGPVKAEVTIIKSDDIEEVKLDERNATKSVPSKILQDIHKKPEEPAKFVEPQRIIEPVIEKPKEDTRYKFEEIKEKPKPPEPVRFKTEEVLRPKVDAPGVTLGEDRTKKPEEVKEPPKQPARIPIANIRDLLDNEMRDMKRFLTTPIRKGVILQCSIRRDKSGFNRLFPKYFMQTSEGLNFLLAGKKRAGNRTSNYMITMDQKDFNTKSASILGKVRSNFLGTEFLIYDSGLNPKRKGANPSNARCELGVVLYESNIMGSKGPRKMRVLLPSVNEAGESAIWKPMAKNEGMVTNYKEPRGGSNNMFVYFNKPPKWNEHVQAFVLNFNGRVDKASVKNFQLIDDRDENKIYLQFGRIADQMFNLDFQWPFSPITAFAIALTSFDNKFACE